METYIMISYLNDYIFCPRSIYYHQLYGKFATSTYQQKPQIAGTIAHESIDNKTYSSKTSILQGMEVFCEKYNLCGKIDIYDAETKSLIERKRKINTIYDGYVYQVYAQYYALVEMGFEVNTIYIHDLSQNKRHAISLPADNAKMFAGFEKIIETIHTTKAEELPATDNIEKCKNCIYNLLCDSCLC